VLPILKKHNVPLYVCGHEHILQHLKREGMDFVICGGGAKHREPDQREDVLFGAGLLRFVSVTATA
jgi:tartrate-resistant acid phosphatase type 5